MATKTAKKVTKKAVKKITKKAATIDFSNSIEKIKGSAKTVNNEVLNTATEVIEDLRTNGTKLREVAVNKVKEAIEFATVKNGIKFVKETAQSVNKYGVETAEEVLDGALNGVKFAKETAQSVNKYGLETAEEVLDGTIKNGQAWQVVAKKAIDGSFQLAEKQQEITFEVLETLKGQLVGSAKRFGRLFRNN